MKMKRLMLCLLLLLCACQSRLAIVYNLSERDANEIVVLLASKGIEVEKVPAPTSNTGPGSGQQLWEILVASKQITEALAVLNLSLIHI